MDAKLKHLELIQGVINRLAGNSFYIKGWAVVLLSALLVLVVREDQGELSLLGLLPVLVFWGLDAYFLWQERLFRALYDRVRLIDEAEIDFSMNVGVVRADPRLTWIRALVSRTLIPFYGALAAVVIVVAVVV